MSDWLGLLFFVLLIGGIFLGLKLLSRPQKRTEEEFERNAAENTTLLGAGLMSLQEMLDPSAAKAKEVKMEMKQGRYNKKKREGKADGDADTDRHGDAENN